MDTVKIFVSYSHKNMDWVDEDGKYWFIPWLRDQLKRKKVQFWTDDILQEHVGESFEKIIRENIRDSDIALLLLSQEFSTSDFILDKELVWIKEEFDNNRIKIVPLLITEISKMGRSNIDWIFDLQTIPDDRTPMIDYFDNDASKSKMLVSLLDALNDKILEIRNEERLEKPVRVVKEAEKEAEKAVAEAKAKRIAEEKAITAARVKRLIEEKAAEEAKAKRIAEEKAATAARVKRLVEERAAEEARTKKEAEEKAAAETATKRETNEKKTVPPKNPAGTQTLRTAGFNESQSGNKMRLVNGGTFMMGSPASEPGRETNAPQHRVTLSPFYLSEKAITNEQYCRFLNENRISGNGKGNVSGYGYEILIAEHQWGVEHSANLWRPASGKDSHPVVMVTWFGAKAYCDWANGRLPAEAEWEYACRAGTTTHFHTGNLMTTQQANFNGHAKNAYLGYTQQAGKYAPNVWGLYDMHGNVYEWCNDWYDADYYKSSPTANPQGPASGQSRVLRGGSWCSNALHCSSCRRFFNAPQVCTSFYGFRMAATL